MTALRTGSFATSSIVSLPIDTCTGATALSEPLGPQVAPRPRERENLGLASSTKMSDCTALPEEALQLERVVADRIAVRERRHELVGSAKPF